MLDDAFNLAGIDAKMQDSATGLVDGIRTFADHDSAFRRVKRLDDFAEDRSYFSDRLTFLNNLPQMRKYLEEPSFVGEGPIGSVAEGGLFQRAEQSAGQHFQENQLVMNPGQALSNDTVLKLMRILKFGSNRMNSARRCMAAQGVVVGRVVENDLGVL